MRRTCKIKENIKKLSGRGRNTIKRVSLLSKSPNTRRPEIKVNNSNLIPVNRDRLRVRLLEGREQPLWKRLLGIKNKTFNPNFVNYNYGFPDRSAFNVNKNRVFKPGSKP